MIFSLSKRPFRPPVFECNTGIRLKKLLNFLLLTESVMTLMIAAYPRHKTLGFLIKLTSRSFLRNKSLSIVGTNLNKFDSRHFRITLLD